MAIQASFSVSVRGALFSDVRQLPKAFIYGQIADYRTFESNGPISLLIVVFRPFVMHGLLRFPTWELKNNMIDLEAILGMGVRSVQERLHEVIIKQRMAESFNDYFLKMANQRDACILW